MKQKEKDRQLLTFIAYYLEGIKEGRGNVLPFGQMQIDDLWRIIRKFN